LTTFFGSGFLAIDFALFLTGFDFAMGASVDLDEGGFGGLRFAPGAAFRAAGFDTATGLLFAITVFFFAVFFVVFFARGLAAAAAATLLPATFFFAAALGAMVRDGFFFAGLIGLEWSLGSGTTAQILKSEYSEARVSGNV
jgi:hypothetical protein